MLPVQDLGRVANQLDDAIARAGALPARNHRDHTRPDRDDAGNVRNIGVGLLVAILVILLLLAPIFQSLRLSFVVMSTVPAVLAGVALMLAATRTTLNVPSFMGAIMAIGVAVANAILLVTFAEQRRIRGGSPLDAAIDAARARMRPV
jgi:multidrug efflux pump subunit AcrB